jgi:two-component system sensor histidine kinase YesM
MMAEIDGQFTIADSINSLGAMMRYNMKWNSEFSTLNEEISHIQNYIALMNVRFDNKINLNIQVASDFIDHEILKMSLQPLVENSVKHGLRNMLDDKEYQVCVYAFCEGNYLKVIVEDNGIGMTEEEVSKINRKIYSNEKLSNADLMELKNKKSTGIGLKNVNERIKLFYGDIYGIEVFSELNEYTKVVMTLPY